MRKLNTKITIMRIKLLLSVFVFFLALNTTHASFPVKRVTNVDTKESVNKEEVVALAATGQTPDKWVGVALWFFLSWPFAAHRWYYKKPVGYNILFILTLGGLLIWSVIDLINILTDNF